MEPFDTYQPLLGALRTNLSPAVRGQYVYLEPRVAEDVPQSEALDYDRVVRRSMGLREAQRNTLGVRL